MNTKTKEQVQEYFKNAKVIKDKYGDVISYNQFNLNNIFSTTLGGWIVKFNNTDNEIMLYSNTSEKYAEIIEYKEPIKETPEHYDNSTCTLYKIAEVRNWNPYLFDIVKRLERSEKKGEFESDLNKSKVVIDLWLSEKDKDLKIK